MEARMAGILDFLTDIGGDRDLSGGFVSIVSRPDCTQQDLLDFFAAHDYSDVTPADVAKIMTQRQKIKEDFSMPEGADY
jgi:hypothetical protein